MAWEKDQRLLSIIFRAEVRTFIWHLRFTLTVPCNRRCLLQLPAMTLMRCSR